MENQGAKIIHTDPSTPYRRVMSVSSMMMDNVYNHGDEEIGSIKEIMIDVTSTRIAYVVLSVDGFLGLGERLFPVPWDALRLDEDNKCFRMDASKDRLKQAPAIDKDHWPDMTDPSWGATVNQYWRNPAAAPGPGPEHRTTPAKYWPPTT